MGTFEFYVDSKSLLEISSGIKAAPITEFKWQIGSKDPQDRFAYYLSIRCYSVRSGGECALEIIIDNNQSGPERESSEFSILALPADLDRVSELLTNFSELKHEVLEWSLVDGRIYNSEDKKEC